MKQITYVCNMCKKQIPFKDYVYRIFTGVVDAETDELKEDETDYMPEVGEVDLCSSCITKIDKEIAKMISKGNANCSKSVSSEKGRRSVKLDMNEIIEMRNQGVSLNVIAKKYGCSPQTIQNRLLKMNYYLEKHEDNLEKGIVDNE